LGRPENAESARWICQHVLPRLRAQGTDFQLVLAGSNPPADLAGYRGGQVEITGFIADPADQFARAHLAIAPLFQGAGVKVKVLECLAAGLPVLTTEIGSEGIEADAAEGLRTLPPDPQSFARAVAELSADRERLAGLAAAATAWGERFRQDHRAVLLA
jgi:glycosyltransferase involved in cell wall biosynthesis